MSLSRDRHSQKANPVHTSMLGEFHWATPPPYPKRTTPVGNPKSYLRRCSDSRYDVTPNLLSTLKLAPQAMGADTFFGFGTNYFYCCAKHHNNESAEQS